MKNKKTLGVGLPPSVWIRFSGLRDKFHNLFMYDSKDVMISQLALYSSLFYSDYYNFFFVVFTIKTVFRGIGGSILAFSAFKLLRRGSTYDQLVTAISTCILPAGIKLIEMAEGSVNLKVQAENRLALDSLWRMYKNGTLKARLEALFVTDEMRELAGGEGVEVIVTIDEQEYENARYELTTEARGNVMMLCHH